MYTTHRKRASIRAFIFAVALVHPVLGHIKMSKPTPRNVFKSGVSDWNLMAPLGDRMLEGTGESLRAYPCSSKPRGKLSETWKAGQKVSYTLEGVPHAGGFCQTAISYDGGSNWVVIDEVHRNCLTTEFSRELKQPYVREVTLPANMPSCMNEQGCIFAWTWLNNEGNREFYTQCVDVNIEGASDAAELVGPELFVANLQHEGMPYGTPQTVADKVRTPEGEENFRTIEKYFSQRAIIGVNHGKLTVHKEACYENKPGAPKWRNWKVDQLAVPGVTPATVAATRIFDASNGKNSCDGHGWKFGEGNNGNTATGVEATPAPVYTGNDANTSSAPAPQSQTATSGTAETPREQTSDVAYKTPPSDATMHTAPVAEQTDSSASPIAAPAADAAAYNTNATPQTPPPAKASPYAAPATTPATAGTPSTMSPTTDSVPAAPAADVYSGQPSPQPQEQAASSTSNSPSRPVCPPKYRYRRQRFRRRDDF